MEACSILLQHVSVVLPATALCEHLQQADCKLERLQSKKVKETQFYLLKEHPYTDGDTVGRN